MPVVMGLCEGYFPMYAYDSESGTCKEFIYGGCGGNDNRFSSLELCMEACAAEPVVDPETPASGN